MAITHIHQFDKQIIQVSRDRDGRGAFTIVLEDFKTNIRYDERRFENGTLKYSSHLDMITNNFHGEHIIMKADGTYSKRNLNQKPVMDILAF